MQFFRSRTAAALAILGAFSVTATPVLARGYGGYDDWGRHHRRHDGGGVDAGSLLAGLLVGGAAVAIATSANKKSSDDRGDEPAPYRYPGGPAVGEQGYGDAPPLDDAPVGTSQGNFGGAVDACSAELERGNNHVDSVEGVRRMGERYSVEGRLQSGSPYACSVDETGHVRSVAVDGHAMI
ncbi:hypothetical protein [Novosphingobium sp. AP12]|uniref:hypothetical protein n=1 Tax=Novosphingobium sp. AP12 TaxID=1144305 RepID=UPI00027214DE|nr:hypothetical protein [Novosphingobium sp. AP12]EJL30166.1 hypothetical protein PMI02_02069 [Novosphingobium sp. AP12]